MPPEIVNQQGGARGIVAGGQQYSVRAGKGILENGGNAIDAGVATVFAASVAEISHFGFGGESPTTIYEAKTGQVVVINGQGPAPKAATPDLFKARGKIDSNGPLAATLPAVMDAMAMALENYGTMRLEQVMAPAIELADGFPMYEILRNYLVRERKANEPYEWTMKTYYPGGKIPNVGEIFRQPNLAKTLRMIVGTERAAFEKTRDRKAAIRAGRDAFYQGNLARRIAEANRTAGGIFTVEDLENFHGRIEQPVSTTFHGFEIYKAGPWNQGPALLQTLNILEGIDLASMGYNSADYLHTVHEAIKLSYDDRNAYYGDPEFIRVPITGLLSKEYAAERRKQIESRASLEHRLGNPFAFDGTVEAPTVFYRPHSQGTRTPGEPGDTTCVDVVDRDGNLFSSTPSSGWLRGGAFIAGNTGVPLSNRMQVFDLDPNSPNFIVGGKRPRTTLSPTIVLKDRKPFLAISAPGGDSQDQRILKVLLNMIEFGMSVQEAIEAPGFYSLHPYASFGNHQSHPGYLVIESRIAPEISNELKARGHKLRILGPWDIGTGVVAVGVNPVTGMIRGGADPRRERYKYQAYGFLDRLKDKISSLSRSYYFIKLIQEYLMLPLWTLGKYLLGKCRNKNRSRGKEATGSSTMPEKDLYARSGIHSPGLLQKFYQRLWRTEQILVRPAAELPQVLISFVKRDHEGAERLRKSLEGTWLNLPDTYRQRYVPILERTPKLIVVLLCRRNNCGCLGHHHPPGTESKLTHMQRGLSGVHVGELDLAFEAIREWNPLPLSHLALSLENAEDEFTSFQLQLGLLAVFLEKLHQLVSPGEPEEAVRGQCQAFYSEVLSHFVTEHYRVEYGLRYKPSKIPS